MSNKRIGILTSGGDCPGLNAVLRGASRAAEKLGWELLGFKDGFEGLLPPGDFRLLDRSVTSGIMHLGGTILGTVNKGHFVTRLDARGLPSIPGEVLTHVRKTFDSLKMHALIVVGGDGSLATALQLHEAGFRVVGVPKTIDNDLEATSRTFGFDSAVACVADPSHGHEPQAGHGARSDGSPCGMDCPAWGIGWWGGRDPHSGNSLCL